MKQTSFNDLKGKVCVITGGAGVLGSAMVKAMASVGLKIAIADINKEVADKVAAEIAAESGSVVIGVEANVLDKASLETAKTEINEKTWRNRHIDKRCRRKQSSGNYQS